MRFGQRRSGWRRGQLQSATPATQRSPDGADADVSQLPARRGVGPCAAEPFHVRKLPNGSSPGDALARSGSGTDGSC